MGIALLVGCSDDCPTCNVPDKPTAPCDPSPATGASGVPDGIVLSWDCGECECGLEVTYDIHFGADTEPPLVSSDFEQKRYSPGPLEPGTYYYWKIVARSSVGSTPGELWDFQTAAEDTCTDMPTAPCNPFPASGAEAVPVETVLTWECGETRCGFTVTYDVYFGRGTAPPLVCGGCSTKTYEPGVLEHGARYFWKVVASDSAGSTPGPVWNLWTEEAACTDSPTAPCNPSPADGTSDVPLDGVLLTWECGESQCGLPVTYDIYFGEASVGDQLVCSDCTTRTYDPGTLSRSRIYVWWVVAKDSNGEAFTGSWAFMTTAGDLRSWYIKADGTGDVPTIQAGVDTAAAGDTLLLADGVYEGPGNGTIRVVGRNMTIRSESGVPEQCIIDCRSTGHAGFYFSMCSGHVEGLSLLGTATALEAKLGAVVQVNNCIIDGCVNRAVVVTGWPGGVYSHVGLAFCEIMSNQAGVAYVAYKCGLGATECVFANNGYVADLGEQAEVSLDRCTIVDNDGGDDGLVRSCDVYCFSSAVIRRSILAFNSGTLVDILSCDVNLECSDIYGNTDGDYVGCLAGKEGIDGNFSLDPGFCDYTGGDFRPRLDSPCTEGNHPDGSDCGRIGAFAAGCD